MCVGVIANKQKKSERVREREREPECVHTWSECTIEFLISGIGLEKPPYSHTHSNEKNSYYFFMSYCVGVCPTEFMLKVDSELTHHRQ